MVDTGLKTGWVRCRHEAEGGGAVRGGARRVGDDGGRPRRYLAFCPEMLVAFDFLLSILRIQAPLLTFPMADIIVEPRAT